MHRLALLHLVYPKTFGEIILIFVFLKNRHWNGTLNIFLEVEGFQLSINMFLPIREIRLLLKRFHIRRSAFFKKYDTDEN